MGEPVGDPSRVRRPDPLQQPRVSAEWASKVPDRPGAALQLAAVGHFRFAAPVLGDEVPARRRLAGPAGGRRCCRGLWVPRATR